MWNPSVKHGKKVLWSVLLQLFRIIGFADYVFGVTSREGTDDDLLVQVIMRNFERNPDWSSYRLVWTLRRGHGHGCNCRERTVATRSWFRHDVAKAWPVEIRQHLMDKAVKDDLNFFRTSTPPVSLLSTAPFLYFFSWFDFQKRRVQFWYNLHRYIWWADFVAPSCICSRLPHKTWTS